MANANANANANTKLFAACESGDLEQVKTLVEAGADVNATNPENRHPLHLATNNNHVHIVQYLLSKGADVNGKNKDTETTALILAAAYGFYDIAKALIEAGADVNQQSKMSCPLRAASILGHLDVVKLLVESGADINMITGQKESYDATALIAASEKGKIDVVNYLLSKGADVNIKGLSETPAIIFACKNGHFDVVKSLVEAGADINVNNAHALTPLSAAIHSENADMVSYLISKGVNLNVTFSKLTPVYYATILGSFDVVKVLVDAGADFTKKSNTHFSPLHGAVKTKHKDIVAFLLSKGVDVNEAYDGDKKTVLFVACEIGSLEIVKMLVDAGADWNITRKDGKTAYDVAISKNHNDIVAYLDSLRPKWKGFTQSDISKFNTLFELDIPAGQQFPPANDYSTCPVCLKFVPRGPGCMYMTHNCSTMGGYYHKDLYNKYKNEHGSIEWCTICGRICNNSHYHYELGLAKDNVPKAIVQPRNPFSNDCHDGNGGGGLPEKFARIRRLREIALELQDEIGKILETDAFTALVEETWNAPLHRSFKIPKIMAERKWNISVNAFPPNAPPAAPNEPKANNGNYNKPDAYLEPIVRIPGDDGYKGDEGALNDSVPSIQYRHKKADGTMNEDHEQIGVDSLSIYIYTGGEHVGKCFSNGCGGLLWPREIEMAFADPRLAVSQGDKDRVAAYKARFNGWHTEGAIGGRRTLRRHKAQRRRKAQTRRRK